MASDLIETARIETLVQSGLPESELEIIIGAADEAIVRFVGPHDGSRKEVLRLDPHSPNVYLPRPAASVSEVKEWIDAGSESGVSPLDSTEYELLGNGRYLRRRVSSYWRRNVAVTYTPQGDNARRSLVLVDLVKWELARNGTTRRRVGQEESYTGSERERDLILARLRQNYAGGGLLA